MVLMYVTLSRLDKNFRRGHFQFISPSPQTAFVCICVYGRGGVFMLSVHYVLVSASYLAKYFIRKQSLPCEDI